MTEKQSDVREIVPAGSPLPDSGNPDLPAAPVPDEPQVLCGYIIGVRDDGAFIFDILGKSPGIIELIGLHEVAGERIRTKMDKQLGGKYNTIISGLKKILSTMQPTKKEPGIQ